ncbi:DUF1217 domain-containing protein [Rhizobium sp. KVB221]|uniref:DUF1217 domain-containing protein n=1 Tax=Rhizobium setariae TaxID=2801340 RepID=A0A937CMC8_9HYPH|nr:DUF1217 domain-containing protein [Rhizobium setariae]MBL0370779.1 DUF1217 domain-containing protein [Rhizobium setariae]
MVSTFLSYNLVNRDLKANLERVGSSTTVARAAQYYKDNIGKVNTVEEFVGDYRLFSYAMKAHGLEDMTYAKAFMKKVLDSDLTDDNSFANKLTDDRYRKFAEAFQFSSGTAITQTSGQVEDVINSYKKNFELEAEAVSVANAYFKNTVTTITSVDQLLNNGSLRDYALDAFGLDKVYWNRDFLTNVLTSDVSDPGSFVNTLTAKNKSDYVALAAAFNFNAAGGLDAGVSAQDASQTNAVVEAYTFTVPSRTVPAAAELNKVDFENHIGLISNVSDLVNDARMLSYVKTAFGLPNSTLKATVENILTSDLSDPSNYATTMGGAKYEALARAFNFQADGSLASGTSAQTATQTATTSSLYMERYDDPQEEADDGIYEFYRSYIGGVDSFDELTGTKKLYNFVLAAFGFDPSTTKEATIKKALTSDLSDPKSFANTQKDGRFKEMAAAFNFNSDGEKTAPLLAQSQSTIQQTAKDYVILKTRYGHEDEKEDATKEAKYYADQVQNIRTVSDFLGNSRLVNFVLEANGIDPEGITKDFMKQLFESDLNDPKSFANQQSDHRFTEIVGSFNFGKDGNLATRETGIQGRYGQMMTQYLYLQQSLEEQTGEDNSGARLALYFKRMMPEINTAYDILGDPALLEVFRTTFDLPAEMSTMDIDKQKALVERHMDFAELQDPDKLEKFVGRFTAMYDLANGTDSDPTLALFSNNSGGISADTLLSIAQLKR